MPALGATSCLFVATSEQHHNWQCCGVLETLEWVPSVSYIKGALTVSRAKDVPQLLQSAGHASQPPSAATRRPQQLC